MTTEKESPEENLLRTYDDLVHRLFYVQDVNTWMMGGTYSYSPGHRLYMFKAYIEELESRKKESLEKEKIEKIVEDYIVKRQSTSSGLS